MKILAIRGKNLASLAGEFEVDFGAEPLKSAGLFAICGPTGAGKSTLLDALCLALYDDTPRLLRASGKGISLPDVGDKTVTPSDTRNLLRRGSAEGHAEVDFIGNDGHTYRARWGVRRARGKAEGSLLKIDMSLKRLPELQPIGGTNSEIKQEIVQRIGLSFEQFTRAVLLAQNEFSAFLKADDNERGELLETLTGSAVYSELSQRAFTRAKDESALLARLLDRLADARPLAEDERAQLEHNAQAAEQELAQLDQHHQELNTRLRWHEQERECREQHQQALEQLRLRQAEQTAAEPRRRHLREVEAVQPARALIGELDRLQRESAHAETAIADCGAKLEQAAQTREQAEKALQQSNAALQRSEQQCRDATPQLDQARLLDAQIETMAPAYGQAQDALEQSEQALNQARRTHQTTLDAQGQAQQAQKELVSWLGDHAHLRPLAEQWPRWDSLLAQAGQCALESTRLQEQLTRVLTDAARHGQEADAAEAACKQAALALENAQARRNAAQVEYARFDVASLHQRRQTLEIRRERLHEARHAWVQLAEQKLRERALQQQQKQIQENIERSDGQLAELHKRLPVMEAALTQAERSLKLTESACADNVEDLRATLEPDTPCPVCGATEHPYAQHNPQLHALLARMQKEVSDCRRQLQEAQQQQATLAAQRTAASAQLDTIRREQTALQQSIAGQDRQWQTHSQAVELAGTQADEAWFARQVEQVHAQLDEVGSQEKAWRQATQVRDEAQAACDNATQTLDRAREQAGAARTALQQAQAARQSADERLAECRRRLDGGMQELEAAFAAGEAAASQADWQAQWQVDWLADPQAFHDRCAAQAREWQTRHDAHDEGQRRLAALALELASLSEACARQETEYKRAAQVLAECRGRLDQLREARALLFGGEPAQKVQARLDAAIHGAKQELSRQTQAGKDSQQAHARCVEALEQARLRLQNLSGENAQAQASLQAWIARCEPVLRERLTQADAALESGAPAGAATSHGFAALRTLLEQDADFIAAERAALHAFEIAVQQAQAVVQERHARCLEHERRRPREAGASAAGTLMPEKRTTAAEAQTQFDWSALAPGETVPLFGDTEEAQNAPLHVMAEPDALSVTDLAKLDLLEPLPLEADPVAQLQEAMATLTQQRTQAQSEVARLQLARAQDAQRRSQSAAMLDEVSRQEETQRVWSQLSELIGSSDGKKFRNYAQQYTLDVLIGYANRHLYDLARRYRLQRIADTLALMVVDQDMGDEMRSVHSLSGGESFLVSLALALGLASLSSNRVRVESLFIDEGFGSLDGDTLRVAMDALDGLQALGRKVGVISHVQEMTERIATKILVQRTAGGKSVVRVA